MGDATTRLLDARTAGPWAHDPPGSGTVVSTVYRGRVVAQCDRLEDADAIARSYEEWPAALERELKERSERVIVMTRLEISETDRAGLRACLASVVGEKQVAVGHAQDALRKLAELASDRRMLAAEVDARGARIAELERMLTAWQKHRHSPSLLADWTRYQKEKQ